SGGLGRWLLRLGALVGLVLLGYFTIWYGVPAAQEAWWGTTPESHNRGYEIDVFNGFLRFTTGLLYVLWTLGVAANASAAVAAEREEDTWLSLISTPLSGGSILLPKMLGAAWSVRPIGEILLLLW